MSILINVKISQAELQRDVIEHKKLFRKWNKQSECEISRCSYEWPCHGYLDDRNFEPAACEIRVCPVEIDIYRKMATIVAEEAAANELITKYTHVIGFTEAISS